MTNIEPKRIDKLKRAKEIVKAGYDAKYKKWHIDINEKNVVFYIFLCKFFVETCKTN